MKKTLLIGIAVAFASLAASQAAPSRRPTLANSADAPTRAHRPNIPNMPDAALSPSNADVGDGDSFGRTVNFLGYAVTDDVEVRTDCTGFPPERCALRDPEGSNAISYIGNEAVVKLPARAAHSLLCFTLTPLAGVFFWNTTDANQLGYAFINAQWRIDSDVLKDPSLIDPSTGSPFNGSLNGGAPLYWEERTLVPHASDSVDPSASRGCISGHLSRRYLIDAGLSEAQAREFFRKPMTIHFGVSVQAQFAEAGGNVGVRVYGD
jgi:hypothetical protein